MEARRRTYNMSGIKKQQGFPVFVAEEEGRILGLSSIGPFEIGPVTNIPLRILFMLMQHKEGHREIINATYNQPEISVTPSFLELMQAMKPVSDCISHSDSNTYEYRKHTHTHTFFFFFFFFLHNKLICLVVVCTCAKSISRAHERGTESESGVLYLKSRGKRR